MRHLVLLWLVLILTYSCNRARSFVGRDKYEEEFIDDKIIDDVIIDELETEIYGVEKADSIFVSRLNLILSDLGDLQLKDVSLKEQKWGTFDNTPSYGLGIAESYYPNPNKHKIDTCKTYLIHEDSLISNTIEYFSTKENGLVRVILIEWKNTLPFISANLEESAKKAFERKSVFLEDTIISKLGTRIYYREDKEMENYKTILWKTFNGFTINLENTKTFNRIRLIIYKNDA